MPPPLVLEVALQISRALVAAEARGLVHRDLKPANVMLAGNVEPDPRRREQTWVKVIDFGLAKALSAAAADGTASASSLVSPATHGAFVGTPGFASPEQFELAELDVRSDVYSLGVTLWFALTGHLPYDGDTLAEIHDRQTHRPLPVAQLTDAGTPPPLVELLLTMLLPDPARRPASARALCEAVEACLAVGPGEPPRWSRRGLARAAAAALVLIIGGGAALAVSHPWKPALAPAPVEPVAPLSSEKSVAVLPFENLSADEDSLFFARGIQNDLIANLGRLADLKVIGHHSVASYPGDREGRPADPRATARALGVAYLLEGSVQRAGHRVRVNARLIDARSGSNLWSKRYDRDLADIFALQDELAGEITTELRVQLSPAERVALRAAPTADLAAYDLNLRARQLLDAFDDTYQSHEMVPAAIRLLEEAVARDPAYLRAWCDLVRAHMALYWYGFDHTPERLALARAALDAAVRLDPNAGETHLAGVDYYYHGFCDYERARTELALARQTLPNEPNIPYLTGLLDRRQGRWDESERNFQRALELDPRDTKLHHQLATNYRCQRRYADAARVLDAALAITPGAVILREFRARLALDASGDPEPLSATDLAVLRQDSARAGDVAYALLESFLCRRDAAGAEHALTLVAPAGIPVHGVSRPRAWFEGVVARTFGDEPRARAAFLAARAEIERLTQSAPGSATAQSVLGLIDAYLGRREEAIREGGQAVAMLPTARHAIEGPELLINLALIFAKVGEPDLALGQLEAAASVPSLLSYGLLKCHPQWDSLRGSPRFDRLLAKLSPSNQ